MLNAMEKLSGAVQGCAKLRIAIAWIRKVCMQGKGIDQSDLLRQSIVSHDKAMALKVLEAEMQSPEVKRN